MKQQAIVALGLLTLASCVHPSPSPAPETPPEPDAGASAPNEPTPEVRAAVDAALAARRAASVAALAPRTPLAAPLEAPTCDADAKLPRTRPSPNQLQPPYDPEREHTLIGAEGPAVGHPAWPVVGDGVAPAAANTTPDRAMAFGPPLTDAMIRARFSTADALDLTVVVRASGEDALDGYGVRFLANTVQWVRLDDGVATPLAPPEVVHRLSKRPTIELVALTAGPNLLAQVHDATSGVEIAMLHARDATYTKGLSGLTTRDDHTNPPTTTIDLLSVRAACQDTPEGTLERPPRRFVTLDTDTLEDLPDATRAALTVRETRGREVVAQTDLLGVERLTCDGALGEVSSEIPWKYADATYLDYRDLPPVRSADGKGYQLDLAPKSPAMVLELMQAYHRVHPKHTRLEVLGHSLQGRPILGLAIARDLQEDDPRPAVLLNGGHHGDEPTSTDISLDAIDQLTRALDDPEHPHARFTRELVTWVVPQVNPDGALAFLEHTWRTGRKNGRDHDHDGARGRLEGVDLNRNYPFRFADLPSGSSGSPNHDKYRGASAGSEPETQAMMRLANQTVPAASISYHSGTVCVLAPYTIDKTPNPRPNDAWAIGREVTDALPEHPEGRPFKLRRNLYAVDGTDQDWLRHEHGTVALLVEAARFAPRDPCARRAIIEVNRPSWVALLARVLDGPTVVGRVVDAAGAPAAGVEVHLGEQELRAGESWRTRSDGRFARFPTKKGRVTLVVRHPDHPEHDVRVAVGEGKVTSTEITLPYTLTSSSTSSSSVYRAGP